MIAIAGVLDDLRAQRQEALDAYHDRVWAVASGQTFGDSGELLIAAGKTIEQFEADLNHAIARLGAADELRIADGFADNAATLENVKRKQEVALAEARQRAQALIADAATPLGETTIALNDARRQQRELRARATKLLRETADPRIEQCLDELRARQRQLRGSLEAFAHRAPDVIQQEIDAAERKLDDIERYGGGGTIALAGDGNPAAVVGGRIARLQAEYAKAVELEEPCVGPRAELAQVEGEMERWEAAKLIADFRDFDPNADSDSNDG